MFIVCIYSDCSITHLSELSLVLWLLCWESSGCCNVLSSETPPLVNTEAQGLASFLAL